VEFDGVKSMSDWHNDSMPIYPSEMGFWDRVKCVLGYHKWQEVHTGPGHPYPGMRVTDRCVRCKCFRIPGMD